jgi:hypothetical protein
MLDKDVRLILEIKSNLKSRKSFDKKEEEEELNVRMINLLDRISHFQFVHLNSDDIVLID